MFCVRVSCIVRVEVTAVPLGVVVGDVVMLEVVGIVVVDEEDAGRVEVVDVVVPVLDRIVVEEEAGIVVVERVLVVREDVELVAALLVVVDEEDETAPGALPTADPTHAFQFVTPF